MNDAQLASQVLSGSFEGLEPDLAIEPGDRVRSYDFAGIPDCFIEGVVEALTEPMEGCPRYKVRVQRCVRQGLEVPPFAMYVYPPVNGTPSWTGKLTNLVWRLPASGQLS